MLRTLVGTAVGASAGLAVDLNHPGSVPPGGIARPVWVLGGAAAGAVVGYVLEPRRPARGGEHRTRDRRTRRRLGPQVRL